MQCTTLRYPFWYLLLLQEARSRALTQLELRYSTLASRLVKARQAVANRDSQVAQLQQALAVAYNALLDAGIDLQQQQSVIWRAITAAAGQQQQSAAVGLPAAACGAAVGSSDSIVNDDVMSMVLSSDASDASVCSSRLGGGTSSVYSSAAGANAAAAASWTAAMESRERQWQIQRLTAECTDKQQKVGRRLDLDWLQSGLHVGCMWVASHLSPWVLAC